MKDERDLNIPIDFESYRNHGVVREISPVHEAALPPTNNYTLADIQRREEFETAARRKRLAEKYNRSMGPKPLRQLIADAVRDFRTDHFGKKTDGPSGPVSRRRVLATGAGLLVLTAVAASQLPDAFEQASKADNKQTAPTTPTPIENQTVSQKIETAETKAIQGTLTQEERIQLAKQWFEEAAQKSALVQTSRNEFPLIHHTTLGARIARLKEGGSIFQDITGEAFRLGLPGMPEYHLIKPDTLIRGGVMVMLGIMQIDRSIKTDNPLNGHVPESFIPQVHYLGDFAKFEGSFPHIFEANHKFEQYPYVYRQLKTLQKAGKIVPKTLHLADYTGISVPNESAALDRKHPGFAVPSYVLQANPSWAGEYQKVAYDDPEIRRAHRAKNDFADPSRNWDERFVYDLMNYFYNGFDMRRSLTGMLGSSELRYAGERYTQLYTVLHQGMGGEEFTFYGQTKKNKETYAPGDVVAVEDAFVDHPVNKIALYPLPSYNTPDDYKFALTDGQLQLITGKPVFMRDSGTVRAVNVWPVRTGNGRFVQQPDGRVIEDKSVEEFKGYFREDWLGKVIKKGIN